MINNKYIKMRFNKIYIIVLTSLFIISCADFDRDFADEEYFTASHAAAVAGSGSTQGLKSLDGAILAYFRDGGSSTDEFGLKAIDMGMDLKGNDMDMSSATPWFPFYQNYDNHQQYQLKHQNHQK